MLCRARAMEFSCSNDLAKGGWSQTLPTKSEADPIKISLQDCLACSGCVTTAETILLEHQSIGDSLA